MRNTLLIVTLICVWMFFSGEAFSFYYKTTPLPEPRQMYGTVVLGDYLYVIGGNNKSGYLKSVLKAPIMPDGTLGEWTPTTPLPHSRAYIANTTIALNDILYVVGGYDGANNLNKQTILWSKPLPNGELSPWQESPPFPGEGISCSVVVSTPGHLHLIGGYTQSDKPTNIVWTAILDERGDFVRWIPGPRLPVPLWFHNAGVVGNRVWVWSGLTTSQNTSVHPMVYSAPILADGRLGQWRMEASRLPQPFYRAACTASGPFLLSFCPSYAGGVVSNDIWFAQVSDKGISPWQKLSTQISPKVYLGVSPDFRRGVIFLPGGRITKKILFAIDTTVYYFRLSRKAYETPANIQAVATITTPDKVSKEPHLSYLYTKQSSPEALPAFIPYEVARQQSLKLRLPMVVYFHSSRARPCQQQRQILQQFDFSPYKGKIVFAWVNTTVFPQLVQQMGIFRVPCWVYFDSSRRELKRKIGLLPADELKEWLRGR
ncbi:hypothetical protein J7M23_00220 [Candidatus Sumerlaeota bacterium]|nr:hypothetical protein [Candidatus Sumerlaeota bacterium]